MSASSAALLKRLEKVATKEWLAVLREGWSERGTYRRGENSEVLRAAFWSAARGTKLRFGRRSGLTISEGLVGVQRLGFRVMEPA